MLFNFKPSFFHLIRIGHTILKVLPFVLMEAARHLEQQRSPISTESNTLSSLSIRLLKDMLSPPSFSPTAHVDVGHDTGILSLVFAFALGFFVFFHD